MIYDLKAKKNASEHLWSVPQLDQPASFIFFGQLCIALKICALVVVELRENRTRLKKKKKVVSGGRCQLCVEIVVFGPNPGIRCSREESFLGPFQSTVVAWELCVHAWVCVCVHACICECVFPLLPSYLLFSIYVLGRPPPSLNTRYCTQMA